MDETILQTTYVDFCWANPDRVAQALTKIYRTNPKVKFIGVHPVVNKTFGPGDTTISTYGAFLTYHAPDGYKLKIPEWTV